MATLQSQSLIIKGRLKCMNQNANSTKGAENIIVVPTFMPSKSVVTASSPSGYFEFNTGVPINRLLDKEIMLYVVSRCSNCKEIAKRIFVTEDDDRKNRNDDKRYVSIKEWMLNTNCQRAELRPLAADSILRIVTKQPNQNLDNVSAGTALLGAPALTNFLNTLITVAAIGPNFDVYRLTTLSPGKINYGKFLLSSPLTSSANTGFNFSPSRDRSEAMFWNPSAIGLGAKPNNISLLTNFKNNVKLGGFFQVNSKLSLAAGGIYTWQDEFRKAVFKSKGGARIVPSVDSAIMKLKEYAAFISPVYKINNQLAISVTFKSIWQSITLPVTIDFTSNSGRVGIFKDSSIKKQYFDVDLSATYKITNFLQAGISLMNLAGTQLYADAFVPGQKNIPFQKLRSLGLGFTYKWQRLNVGTDLLFTENGFYDASFGINYVPFNNALLSAGFAVKQLSYSVAFRIKHFRIAYINDNDWMVNEKRKGKSNILNGRLYGGFIFDLN